MTGNPSVDSSLEALRAGAWDYLPKPFSATHLQILIGRAAHAVIVARESQSMQAQLDQTPGESEKFNVLGSAPAFRKIIALARKVAATDASVFITGESGSGKELIAQFIHHYSRRSSRPLVAINCAALPEALLESEMFGHVKGAFTGAHSERKGMFETASSGTLFLDEVGDMPAALQVKLLRALQERAVTKVGDTRAEPVDIRVIAATNKVLEDEIKKGAFREDLYYRLNVVSIPLPPLRDRGDDVVVIGRWFLQKYAKEFGSRVRGFTPSALVAMRKYAWPGNIRELENRLKKAVVLADRALVSAEDLDLRPEILEPVLPLALAKEEYQKRYINEVLERNGGNRTKTAKDLGVDPRTIFRHLEKLDAERRGVPPPPEEEGDL
jgi:DNA-binding NtrC family response regulator